MRHVGHFFSLHMSDNIRCHYLTLQQVGFDPSKGTRQLFLFFSVDETLDNDNARIKPKFGVVRKFLR